MHVGQRVQGSRGVRYVIRGSRVRFLQPAPHKFNHLDFASIARKRAVDRLVDLFTERPQSASLCGPMHEAETPFRSRYARGVSAFAGQSIDSPRIAFRFLITMRSSKALNFRGRELAFMLRQSRAIDTVRRRQIRATSLRECERFPLVVWQARARHDSCARTAGC
jgi:hypothetical protein